MPERVRDRTQEMPRAQGESYGTRPASVIDSIIIHHSGAQPVRDNAMAFARFHVEGKGWPGIGYHYVVNPDGIVDKCQPITVVTYHAKKANGTGIGVCLAGSFDRNRPTQAQWEAAVGLCRDIRLALPGIRHVIGHSEVPGTDKSCPGARFQMDAFREAVFAGRAPAPSPATQPPDQE